MSTEHVSSEQLRLFIERIETLEEEKKGIADDIKDVYAEAKGTGFDTKTIKAIIRLRKMDDATRREAEALLDTYKAALGMLDGTPLGRWAVERLEKARAPTPAPETAPDVEEASETEDDDGDGDAPTVMPPPPPEKTIDEARAMGAEAARGGEPVTANPFMARDPRRAAWDEAWCAELGSDGMDLPDIWQRQPKGKGDDGKAGE